MRFPDELSALLRETDGVLDQYGGGLIWSVDRIVDENTTFRSSPSFAELHMPFSSVLFFADAGNGDQFLFPLTSVGARRDVFVWDHEDDSRRWYASSLDQYVEWWLGGEHPIWLAGRVRCCAIAETDSTDDGEGRNRTGDTTVFSRVLYQLSYLAAAGAV
jgi:hypothetical protein